MFAPCSSIYLPLKLVEMAKMRERKVNMSGKPKHSLDVNRKDGKSDSRSAATVRRLKMYNSRPRRDKKGKVLSHELQSKELPNTRIAPDRRWFGMLLYRIVIVSCIAIGFVDEGSRLYSVKVQGTLEL